MFVVVIDRFTLVFCEKSTAVLLGVRRAARSDPNGILIDEEGLNKGGNTAACSGSCSFFLFFFLIFAQILSLTSLLVIR